MLAAAVTTARTRSRPHNGRTPSRPREASRTLEALQQDAGLLEEDIGVGDRIEPLCQRAGKEVRVLGAW